MQGLSIENWRRGLGIGARSLWQSTVVRADLARSDKQTGLYITFDQVFRIYLSVILVDIGKKDLSMSINIYTINQKNA